MIRPPPDAADRAELALELAAAAARLIAQDGCDYATAKRKAVQLVLGGTGTARGRWPENDLVESELRRYLRTFAGEGHAARLAAMRAAALALMEYLSAFNPHLVGAVLNGTATEHSALHLHLFTDSAKDVEIFLLNDGVRFEVEEGDPQSGALECLKLRVPRRLLSGEHDGVDAVLSVLPTDGVRLASRSRSADMTLSPIERSGRAGIDAVRALLSGRVESG